MNTFMRSRGFSLVELMVALIIGSFLIIGAVTVYVQSRNTYSVNETVARLQENARYALSTLEPDIRLANYWGLMNDPELIIGTVGNVPLPAVANSNDCGADFAINLRVPIGGVNNGYGLACAAGPSGNAQPGADTIVLRHAEQAPNGANSNFLQLYTTRQGAGSRVFNANTAPGSPASLVVDPAIGAAAEIHDLAVRAYYVAQDSSQGNVPSLRRQNLIAGPDFQDEEILPGIEDLQVQFGIDLGADRDGDGLIDDVDGNGRPDSYNGIATRYVNPGDAQLATAQIVAVRLWIRVRAEAPEVGFTDTRPYIYADVNFVPAGAQAGFRRLLVSRTIQIRNTVNLQT